MLTREKGVISAMAIGLAVWHPAAAQTPPATYSFTVLPAPGGSFRSKYQINNYGQVIGEMGSFLWTPSEPNGTIGTVTNLPFRPVGINASGQVVGRFFDSYIWTPVSPNSPQGSTTQISSPNVTGISDSGSVVGNFTNSCGSFRCGQHAYRHGLGSVFNASAHDLGPNVEEHHAYGVSGSGIIIGDQSTDQGFQAFRTSSAITAGTALGSIPGYSSAALGTNDLGQVVGYAYTLVFITFNYSGDGFIPNFSQSNLLPLVWNSGTAAQIPPLPGYTAGRAMAINDSSVVVGSFGQNTAPEYLYRPQRAFIWNQVNGLRDLNDFLPESAKAAGYVLLEGTGINRSGQISGHARIGNQYVPFLLKPALGPPTGTITVTTNLAGSAFTLTGPATFSGSGTSFTQANAPVGAYTATFRNVPGFITPAVQSGTLTANEALRFNGVYAAAVPDLSISKIEPVQVVKRPNSTLLPLIAKGKRTAATIEVSAVNPAAVSTGVVVNIKDTNASITIPKEAFAGGSATRVIEFVPTASIVSAGEITAIVDPGNLIDEGEREDNNRKTVPVQSGAAKKLHVSFVRIDNCCTPGGYGAVQNLASVVLQQQDYIRTVFPIAALSGSALMEPGTGQIVSFAGSSDTTRRADGFTQGIFYDIARVGLVGSRIDRFADKILGIAPAQYFAFHGVREAGGAAGMNSMGGIINEGQDFTSGAHEVGHMYGLPHDNTSYVNHVTHRGGNVSTQTFFSMMCCDLPGLDPLPNERWIPPTTYEELHRALPTNPVDPELLLIGVLLHKNGAVETVGSFYLPDGNASPSLPGTHAIRLLDLNGRVVESLSVPVTFAMFSGPGAAVPVDTVPLVVKIPLPKEAFVYTVEKQGVVLARQAIATRLLADAIRGIPDSGFDRTAAERRNALLNKVGAFELDFGTKNLKGAVNKLTNDIRKHLEDWLRDGYSVSSPLEYTKAQVLALVDDQITRLSAQAK